MQKPFDSFKLIVLLLTTLLLASPSSAAKPKVIKLEKGKVYEYSAGTVKRVDLHISNHDQPKDHPIAMPLIGLTNVVVKGNGATLRLKDSMVGVLIMDSKNIVIENLTIESEKPMLSEAEITGFKDGKTYAKLLVEGYAGVTSMVMLWDNLTHSIVPRTGDGGSQVRRLEDGTLEFAKDFSQWGAGGKIGDRISMRNGSRPHPIVCLYRAENIKLENVVIHDGYGMAWLSQRSKNIALIGCKLIPREGSFCAGAVDGAHFSNCAGKIIVKNSTFIGMMDDALNIHSTSLRIQEVSADRKTLTLKFMHNQSWGFDIFKAGEKLRFIKAKTLENGEIATVLNVETPDLKTVVVTLDKPLTEGLDVGDAVENATYQPKETIFAHNTVANNRARGILLTAPGKVKVYDNTFDHVSGSAILFSGDASGWFESGACEDVEIKNNKFIACNSSYYQFCNAVISVAPCVPNRAAQKTPYHTNIRLKDNSFVDCKEPYTSGMP